MRTKVTVLLESSAQYLLKGRYYCVQHFSEGRDLCVQHIPEGKGSFGFLGNICTHQRLKLCIKRPRSLQKKSQSNNQSKGEVNWIF